MANFKLPLHLCGDCKWAIWSRYIIFSLFMHFHLGDYLLEKKEMKILYLPAALKFNKALLKNIGIKEKFEVVTTIQYLKEIKSFFPRAKQILGCSKLKKAKAYLYIGTGEFHPLRLTRFTDNIYILNPETKQFYKLNQEAINACKQKLKGNLLRFYSTDRYGIIVSIKPGQYNLKKALKLRTKLKKPSYLFIADNIDTKELENFNNIDCWINTACPRIEHKSIINLEDLPLEL